MDRTKALYGPRTQAYGETKYKKEILQVLDRTKALYGPRTQAYGETKYKKEILQVLDRTKALYGPRTQAYGETKYKKERIITSFGQNQGLSRSSDSSLWGNQVLSAFGSAAPTG